MAFTAYAAAADLEAWLTETSVPSNVDALLRSATFLVALACQRNPFAGAPTGSDAAALNAATCAQAAAWITLNIDPTGLGVDPSAGPIKKSSILGADVERDTSKLADAQLAAARELCPESVAILTASGLIYQPVPLGASPFDPLPQWGQGRRWWPYPEPISGEWEGWGTGVNAAPAASTATVAAPDQVIRVATADTTVAPGEEIWVQTTDGHTITLTILHEPSGQHCRIKRVDNSTGTVLLVPVSGLIDGQSSFTLSGLSAVELDSDGSDFAVF